MSLHQEFIELGILPKDSPPIKNDIEILAYLASLSGLHEGVRICYELQAQEIAEHVITEEGEFDFNRIEDSSLKAFKVSQKLRRSLNQFTLPLGNRKAEALIQECMNLPPSEPITLRHLRSAVLSSCLTQLRQNVGSCFATAPAILIHTNQLEVYLDDLAQLLMRGAVTRVIAGVEYSIPLSPSWGSGDLHKKITPNAPLSPPLIKALESVNLIDPDASLKNKIENAQRLIDEHTTVEELLDTLTDANPYPKNIFKRMTDHPLLKSWEFTIASFSECTMDFSKWNLYSSLGLDPKEEHGIGQVIYRDLDAKLDKENEKAQQFQQEYEFAFSRVKMVEGMLKNASSPDQLRRLKAEHQTHAYQMRMCLEMRDEHHQNAKALSEFFSFLIKQYEERFCDYFQELYDPEMGETNGNIYDDRPAGFRLVYKYGRLEPLTWTFINNKEEYIDALIDFFRLIEPQIDYQIEKERLKEELRRVTTEIIHHLRTDEFLKSALERTAQVQKMRFPKHLAKQMQIENKPWCYVSGGSMEHLLSIYFKREVAWTKEEKVVQDSLELLTFFLETLKELPPLITDLFEADPHQRLLISSPTHAFTFLPGLPFFLQGWNNRSFTYTWIRDQFIYPRKQFYQNLTLTESEQEFLIEQLAKRLPPMLSHHIQRQANFLKKNATLQHFHNHLHDAGLDSEHIDSFLFEMLPIAHKSHVEKLLGIKKLPNYLGASQLAHYAPSEKLRQLNLLSPKPLHFADTNWSDQYFAFIINPRTFHLELWRTDIDGLRAYPMQQWMNATKKKPWILYTHPHEYFLYQT